MVSNQPPKIAVRVPHRLRPLTGGERVVHLDAGSVGEALAQLVARYPALRSRLCEQGGRLRPSVLFFVNSEDIRTRSGEQTPLSEGDELAIVLLAEGG